MRISLISLVRNHRKCQKAYSGIAGVLTKWEDIKKQEKQGKEWTEKYLPDAFEEAKSLIDAAKERKGFRKS